MRRNKMGHLLHLAKDRNGKNGVYISDIPVSVKEGYLLEVSYFGFRIGKLKKIYPRAQKFKLGFYCASSNDYTLTKTFGFGDLKIYAVYDEHKEKLWSWWW